MTEETLGEAIRDLENEKVGKIGYEIDFNRYYYQYQPHRPLEKIDANIRGQE